MPVVEFNSPEKYRPGAIVNAVPAPMQTIDRVKDVARGTLELILGRASEADLYGLLSGLSSYAQHMLKGDTKDGSKEKPHHSKMPQQGGNYI